VSTMNEKREPGKKTFRVPHTYVILFFVMILVTALTYILPAGQFERAIDANTGREVVVANSFELVENTPVTPFELFMAIPKGMGQGGFIIFFVFLIGGAFGILKSTGAIVAGIHALVEKVKGNEKLLIPLSMLIFSLGGAIFGMAEEMLLFIPIYIALSLALGFDTTTGIAICWLGASSGFAAAFLNPFTVGVAHGITGLPPFSGMSFRIVAYVIIVGISIFYVYRYAARIQKNPEAGITPELDEVNRKKFQLGEMQEFTIRHKLIFLTLFLGIVAVAYGVIQLGYYITELGAIFVIVGLVSGIIGGLKVDEIAEGFVEGAKDMTYGALVIGLATAITVILNEGRIMDTVIYSLSNVVSALPAALGSVAMFVTQSFINLLIPSGSGQAAVTMPIMAPLADLSGITRQTAVLAYQFGDGFSNTIIPTHGVLMAGIAMGGLSWIKWAKWMLPLFLIWSLVGAILLVIATAIQYGPF
jgi:uncharacterized ion transporter superfamily protein YfcC